MIKTTTLLAIVGTASALHFTGIAEKAAKTLTGDCGSCPLSSQTTLTAVEGDTCPLSAATTLTAVEGATCETSCEKETQLTSAESATCASKDTQLTAAGDVCEGACEEKATQLTAGEACEGECDADKKLTTVSLKFAEAQCETSAAAVTKQLTSLEGLGEAKTCTTSFFTSLQVPAALPMAKLLESLKEAGLTVEAQKLVFAVDGMACEACSSKVTKTLTALEGVKASEVCHVSKQAAVTFDPASQDAKTLIEAITELGYEASIQVAAEETAEEEVVETTEI